MEDDALDYSYDGVGSEEIFVMDIDFSRMQLLKASIDLENLG
jgi:hypothetical protein